MVRELKPCGTPAAYRRHLRHGEPACQACLDAEATRARPEGHVPRAKPQHGSASKYKSGCRCTDCKRAQRDSNASWRAAVSGLAVRVADLVPHGLGGYNNYGCRCGVCSAAKSQANAEQREARRARRGSVADSVL